jgi:hypothetical protein
MIDRRSLGTLAFALTSVAAAMALPATPGAQDREALGPSRCVRCHVDEVSWWVTADGPPPRGHVSALLQLESADARRYARRLGLGDVYDVNASCVTCHATVFRGDAREGVSCESCHGPASDYLDVHAEPGAYRLAVAAGMADVVGDVRAWAQRCLTCHLITDRRLIDAGHSSGRAFELGEKFQVVALHWKRTYPADAVSAAGREIVAGMLARSHER